MQGNGHIDWDDTVLPFQLETSDTRGRMVRLDGILTDVLRQHEYPPVVEALVAEMSLLTALIGQSIKLRWKLSLQVQSDGPVRMIATDFYGPSVEGAPARIRAYASYDKDRLDENMAPMDHIGKGYFAILIDQGEGMTPYQGITPLVQEGLVASAESYFAQSEQLPTRFLLHFGRAQEPGAAERWRGGGVMLQKMPKAPPRMRDEGGSAEGGLLGASDMLVDEDLEDWTRVNLHLDTVEALELIGPHVTPLILLHRLFHEETPRVFDLQPLQFGCTCSQDRVRQSLSIYSAKDIETMTTDDGRVTADCQFCGAHYDLDPTSVGFEAQAQTDGS